jgi:molybdopterin-containing oxidoreductase family iron-sulfur binding subunit
MSRRTPYDFVGPAPEQPVWWTSLDDYAQQTTAPEERARQASAEHPEGAWDFSDPVSRRTFMTLMGASISMATLQGCRRPVDKILPYSRSPEDVTVNVTSFYATVIDRRGEGVGLLVESHEGRPTKAEGNPDHPASRGKTDILTQAAVLDLYDPDRSRKPSKGGVEKTYADFEGELQAALVAHASNGGSGLRVLAPPSISPTFLRLREAVKRRFPNARFHTWEAATVGNIRAGAKLAFGQALAPVYDLAQAKRILSIDSDFLQTEPGVVRNTRGWAESRRVHTTDDEPSRLYVVESVFSTTGGNADHRLRLAARDIEGYLMAVAARLASSHGVDLGEAGAAVRSAQAPAGVDAKWIEKVAADLAAHRGHSAVIVGSRQPATAHALAHAINQGLGNAGQTVRYAPAADANESDDHAADLAELVTAMGARQVQTLLILGGNPAYDAPGEHDFGAKLAGVQLSVHLGLRRDETGEKCTWHVPRAHWLEAWGDAQSLDGTVAIQQPLIQPLFSGRSELEVLGHVADAPSHRGYELVRETFRAQNPGNAFERQWRRALNVGVSADAPALTAPAVRGADIAQAYGRRTAPTGALSATSLEVVFTVDAKMYDGRHANNAWLQELPDPVTKITWDNAAIFSPKTAEDLHIKGGDMVRISKGNRSLEIVAWVIPGHPDNTVALPLGWGRTQAGRVGNGKGFNVNPLRPAAGVWFGDGYTVAAAGSRYPVSQTQDHHRMENRPIAIETTLSAWREHPNFAERQSPTPRTLPLWRAPYTYAEGHKWGMSIDLNACTGCNACVVACQSENNIPVVGKEQVSRGREMHWLRIDRYFVSPRGQGDEDTLATSDPLMATQPLGCVHCENAPCENVCPVAATIHSPEGLNEMAYNRCIGTRYCANNCPYKVRRFNYLNWHNDGVYQPEDGDMPEIVRMAMNPNVTVRFRGVMEKCTYCVQRIQARKIESKRENRELRDGEVVTACQQACPADAIVFGDLNLRTARVTALSRDLRRYKLLGEIGTQPRTTYLARIRNPNPEMQG